MFLPHSAGGLTGSGPPCCGSGPGTRLGRTSMNITVSVPPVRKQHCLLCVCCSFGPITHVLGLKRTWGSLVPGEISKVTCGLWQQGPGQVGGCHPLLHASSVIFSWWVFSFRFPECESRVHLTGKKWQSCQFAAAAALMLRKYVRHALDPSCLELSVQLSAPDIVQVKQGQSRGADSVVASPWWLCGLAAMAAERPLHRHWLQPLPQKAHSVPLP